MSEKRLSERIEELLKERDEAIDARMPDSIDAVDCELDGLLHNELSQILMLVKDAEKLPLTADGVRIVPGMEVWSARSATRHLVKSVEIGRAFIAVCDCHGEALRCLSSDAPVYHNGDIEPLPLRFTVFSTRELAEAALAAAHSQEGQVKS
jgi:hypothetical protein